MSVILNGQKTRMHTTLIQPRTPGGQPQHLRRASGKSQRIVLGPTPGGEKGEKENSMERRNDVHPGLDSPCLPRWIPTTC